MDVRHDECIGQEDNCGNLLRRLPLGLCRDVRYAFSRPDVPSGCQGRAGSLFSIEDISQPLYPCHRTASRASRYHRQLVSRPCHRCALLVVQSQDQVRRPFLPWRAALAYSPASGVAYGCLLLAGVRCGCCRSLSRPLAQLRRKATSHIQPACRRHHAATHGKELSRPHHGLF